VAPANQVSVTGPLLVGVATTFFTIIVHALVLYTIIEAVRRYLSRGRAGVFLRDLTLALWALSFVLCGEFSNFAAALYYSAATYTTVGDGSIVISARWRLLGPLEAADGMLMFGVTTAMIFAVIQRLVQAKLGVQRDPPI
jgi:hypothetical protein